MLARTALTYNLSAAERWCCALRHTQFWSQVSESSHSDSRYFHYRDILVKLPPGEAKKHHTSHTCEVWFDVDQIRKRPFQKQTH
jgi:hypothetical protein